MTGKSAKVVVYTRHAGGTRDTTQSEKRHPLEVGPKTQPSSLAVLPARER